MTFRNRLWAVGGGKGGVGKTVVTVLIAEALARRGVNVVLVDADLGGANLHTLLGLRNPAYTLGDFMARRVESLEEVVQPTVVQNLRLISGADDILGIANPKFAQKQRLLTHIDRLKADVILLDLGAGTSTTTTDFFLYAAGKLVVMTPQVTSIQNGYSFIKASLYRHLSRAFAKHEEVLELLEAASNPTAGSAISSVADLRKALATIDPAHAETATRCLEDLDIGLVVNMTRTAKERETGQLVRAVAQRYLDISPEALGVIDFDGEVDRAINHMTSFLSQQSRSTARLGAYDIATKVLQKMRNARAPREVPGDVEEHEPELTSTE